MCVVCWFDYLYMQVSVAFWVARSDISGLRYYPNSYWVDNNSYISNYSKIYKIFQTVLYIYYSAEFSFNVSGNFRQIIILSKTKIFNRKISLFC